MKYRFSIVYYFRRQDDLLQILGQKVSAARRPGPRMRVVIQHSWHDVMHPVLLSKIFTFIVIVVRHTQPERYF